MPICFEGTTTDGLDQIEAVADNRDMSTSRRVAPALLLAFIVGVATFFTGCRTAPAEEPSVSEVHDLTDELRQLESELDRAATDLAERDEQIARLEADFESLQSDLSRALGQLGTLREDRLDLQQELAGLERELNRVRDAAGVTRRPEPADPAPGAGESLRLPQERTQYERVPHLGLRNDPRAARQLASSAPGVGLDTTHLPPVMFDTRLSLDQTGVYLSIVDPEHEPRLVLTVQYIDTDTPLWLHTALVTTEGGDPVDPIEPIVLEGEPIRQTDGRLLREALVKVTDTSATTRLTSMLSSQHLLLTLLGDGEPVSYRPSVSERAAMSNMIYAFIDLGGFR